jgi:WD40 repeat protein
MTNGSVVVADRKNKRIQVLTETGEFVHQFTTTHEPFYVCCDDLNNIVVSTTTGFIEIYRRSATLQHRFQIPGLSGRGQKTIMAACPIDINNKDEVIISHGINGCIQYFSYTGQLLYQFEAVSTQSGLSCQPAGVCVNPLGQILVVDSLNHVINLYSSRGTLLEVLAGPMDGAGAVQSVTIGTEGHLVVTEYSISGSHCIKIFRYRECECHRTRPGSAKKPAAKAK